MNFSRNAQPRHQLRRSVLGRMAVAAAFALPFAGPVAGDDKLCANSIGSNPTFVAPVIDGNIVSDVGWRASNLYTFNNGSDTPHAQFQMIRDASALYLAIEVNNDPTFDKEDVIVLTLAPNSAAAASHRRIHIFPNAEGVGNVFGPGAGGAPSELKYWTNSASWTSAPPPTWLQRNSDGSCTNRNVCVKTSSPALANKSWYVEVRIPISTNPDLGVELPASGDFGLYFNVIRAKPAAGGGTAKEGLEELRWPSTAPLISANPAQRISRIDVNTPAASTWGSASLVGPCAGIAVKSQYSNNANNWLIDVNSTNNIFTVELKNTGSAPGIGVTAQLLSASFGLAGPGDFVPYPPSSPWSLPMGPSGAVPPDTQGQPTVKLQTPAWNLVTDPNRQQYINQVSACSKIVLSTAPTGSGAPTTLIANRIASHNMYFGTASRFEHTAVLGTRGYEAPTDPAGLQHFQLLVATETDELIYDRNRLERSDPRLLNRSQLAMASQGKNEKLRFFRKTVCGYRETGREVIIEGTKVRMLESADCFGYLLSHEGQVGRWTDRLAGSNGVLEPVRGVAGNWRASVQHGQTMNLQTVVEAKPPGQLGGICSTLSGVSTAALMLVFTGVGATAWRRQRSLGADAGQGGSEDERRS